MRAPSPCGCLTRALLAAALAALLLGGAAAQESELSQQLGNDIAKNQTLLERTRAEIARLDAELADLSASIAAQLAKQHELEGQITALAAEGRELEAQIQSLAADLEDTEAELAGQHARLEDLKGRLSVLLVNLYKQKGGRFAGILAKSGSLHDLQVKNHYMSLLTDQQVSLVEDTNATLRRLQELQTRLTAQVKKLRDKQSDLEANRNRLEAHRAELAGLIADLKASEEGREAARRESLKAQEGFLTTITSLKAAREAEIARLRREAEEQRQAALAAIEARQRERLMREAEDKERAANALATPAGPTESKFVLPVAGAKLAAPFGSGGEPGIVLRAAEPYAPVRAVLSGVVVRSQFHQANTGYLVMIQHGAGPDLYTFYRNLQPPLVEVGDRVVQGQIIGYLGGGTLVSPDTLFFNVAVPGSGGTLWQDPAPMLGLR